MKSKSHFLTDLNLTSILDPADPQDKNYCATKIVGTIGPACQTVENQVAMLEAGMSAARWVKLEVTSWQYPRNPGPLHDPARPPTSRAAV